MKILTARVLYLIIIIALPLGAQNLGNLNFINDLADKDAVTYSDAVTFFIYMENKNPAGFQADVQTLQKLNITTGIDADREKVLTRGMLSAMVARYLDLKDSLYYVMSPYRAVRLQGLSRGESYGLQWQ